MYLLTYFWYEKTFLGGFIPIYSLNLPNCTTRPDESRTIVKNALKVENFQRMIETQKESKTIGMIINKITLVNNLGRRTYRT